VLRRYSPPYPVKKYTKSHEWVEMLPERSVIRLGISNHAQEQLGEVIHVEFPSVGKAFEEGESAIVIESVKIAADIYAPVTGKVVGINKEIEQ
jgi:glycine cleavage system H protein